MPKICQRYDRSKYEATNSRQLPKAEICKIYAKDMLGVVLRLKIQDNYLNQRYTKDMPRYGKDNYLKLWALNL